MGKHRNLRPWLRAPALIAQWLRTVSIIGIIAVVVAVVLVAERLNRLYGYLRKASLNTISPAVSAIRATAATLDMRGNCRLYLGAIGANVVGAAVVATVAAVSVPAYATVPGAFALAPESALSTAGAPPSTSAPAGGAPAPAPAEGKVAPAPAPDKGAPAAPAPEQAAPAPAEAAPAPADAAPDPAPDPAPAEAPAPAPAADEAAPAPAPAQPPAPAPAPAAPAAPAPAPAPQHLSPVDRWINKANQILTAHGTHLGPADVKAVKLIIAHESGGDPNAVNNWDSNAAAGHPSEGLMQTIPSTFQAHALPGYDQNIKDPVSNIIAGVRYAISRYGSLANVPGVKATRSGASYVGY